jgi:hypothetical protein
MQKNKYMLFGLILAVAAPLNSSAGMFDAVTGAKSDSSSEKSDAASGDVVAKQGALVKSYVSANKLVLMSQYKIALALGAKDAAALAKAEADALSSGSTKDNLSKADSTQSEVSKAISERQADKSAKLDSAAKKQYTDGLVVLAKGLREYVAMTTKVDGFKNALANTSPTNFSKLESGSYVVKSFPVNSKNVYDTLSQAVSFAKSNDIPVPADATKAL